MNKNFYRSALQISAAAAALSLVTISANAAECFDRDTNDPKAGNATAVIGPAVDVERVNRSDVFRPRNGADMYSGDRVRTGTDSHLQLKLCDWSTYTFSPDSESAISEFFDNQGAGRRRVVNFFRGGMRFASGRDTQPGSTEVEIQESGVTMGVRGTNVILVELDGFVYALLEGPVRDNSGLTPKGLVEFWSDDNRDSIEAVLMRPGFAVRIGPDGVSEPFRADAELLKRIYKAFVPEGDGGSFDYAGDALDESGQGTQEGDEYKQYAENKNETDDEETDQRPGEEDEEEEIQPPPPPPPPPMIPVGDILPLDALEDFAAAQQNPEGHIFVIAPASMVVDNDGIISNETGVAMFQIAVDWATRTVAPDALASFVKFDFSVTDPDDLTQRDFSGQRPFGSVLDMYFQALLASSNVPFASGAGGLATFNTPTFVLTIRQGVGDTVTADVSLDYSATDPGQGTAYMISSSVDDLTLIPGVGDLAYFSNNLGETYSLMELDFIDRNDVAILSGSADTVASTLGVGTKLIGTAVAQLEVDFGNRTIGGGSSFIAFATASNAATGGSTAQHVSLDQAVSFDSGLFGLAFHTLSSMSSDANVLQGQAQIENPEGLGAYIASIIADGSGNHIYSEVEVFEDANVGPLSSVTELDTLSGLGDFNYYDGTGSFSGGASLIDASGNYFFGSVDTVINIGFSSRTIGGGGSFVAIDVGSVDVSEMLNTVSFDDALNGFAAFGFDADDFSGTNIDAALLLIRNSQQTGTAGTADFFINFNDGAGGLGSGEVRQMPLSEQG